MFEDPIPKEQMHLNSVDLTLDGTARYLKPNAHLFARDTIDTAKTIEYETVEFRDTDMMAGMNGAIKPSARWICLEPGQFCLMSSKERLNIPNGILPLVRGGAYIAQLAVQISDISLLQPGFNGPIVFEVFNRSNYPIILYEGMVIAQVYFLKAQLAT